ncbi:MAG TPA: hypothetical protein VE523_06845 [Solirubrobacterales bacterium]|nr:hypothetical protein [Solirubrobacterales bacterium]
MATLRVGRRLGGDATRALRFSPENSGGGMEPAGLLNRLRPAAYAGSRRGWRGQGGNG